MPRQKDLKRIVRARMRKTGESYTAARAHVLRSKPAGKKTSVPVSDYARVAGMSDAAVKAKTGCAWDRWVKSLDHHGAADMRHAEIARLIREKWKVDGWWSQMVAVGYERIKGLRTVGQRRSGTYDASKSKTFAVSAARLYRALTSKPQLERWLPGAVKVRRATPEKSVRLELADGAVAAFWFTKKGDHKTTLAVQQERLPDEAARERAKRYWGERLAALAEVVS